MQRKEKKKKKSSITAKVNSHIVQEENIMWPQKKQWFNSLFSFEFIFKNFNSSAFSGGNYDEWGHQIYMTWLGNITK